MPTETSRVINFGAGPSALPLSVLEEAAQGLIDFNGTGIGIAEISHRSKDFTTFLQSLEQHIRAQLEVPATHAVLFTQGGGTGQFSAVVLNMLVRHRLLYPDISAESRVVDYVITGSWSKKAAEEARRLGGATVHVAADARRHSPDGKSYPGIPPHDDFKFSDDPAMIYYCENETVDGVQFDADEGSPGAFPYHLLDKLKTANNLLPLVADYSSSFMSRPIPRLADHAIIFAGAQKNLGPAGLTILIVRKDCIVDVDAAAKLGAAPVPITMAYNILFDSNSLYNTPSVVPIYIAGLVLKRMAEQGGLEYYAQVNRRKQEKLYDVLEEGEKRGLVRLKVKAGSRSWMNVTFDLLGDGAQQRFLEGTGKNGMKSLSGHRSADVYPSLLLFSAYPHLLVDLWAASSFHQWLFVCLLIAFASGIRVSLYNAITEEQVDKLIDYIKTFFAQETKET
jgi:phosphoserine aminotransferase